MIFKTLLPRIAIFTVHLTNVNNFFKLHIYLPICFSCRCRVFIMVLLAFYFNELLLINSMNNNI